MSETLTRKGRLYWVLAGAVLASAVLVAALSSWGDVPFGRGGLMAVVWLAGAKSMYLAEWVHAYVNDAADDERGVFRRE
jgi:hypothetical protein